MRFFCLLFLITFCSNSQNIDVNNDFAYDFYRFDYLDGEINTNFSFNIRPISSENFKSDYKNFLYKTIIKSKKENFEIKFLGLDYFTEFNSHHPYKRNNGSMIPNKGYQHIISPGIFLKLGPLSVQLKPEHHFSENKSFDGFWDGHFSETWAKRYRLWNKIDMPERFGDKRHNSLKLGQSNIKLNWKKISLGISSENLWWGPSIRNSIMLSNNSEGFKHITFNSNAPIYTPIGYFEWQFITGRLESSGYTPPRTDYEHAGTKLYVPKINQNGDTDDWRYLQAFIISYSPKWIDGLSLGFIRWVQMYSALVEGRYWWMEGKPSYFPVFNNLFRKNDKYVDYESQTNQAAGLFLNWIWKDSKARFYAEYHHNDSKQNLRDLILDSDHSRAATIGLEKIFTVHNNKILFHWEWTQMENTASRVVRSTSSWYEHGWVYDGYTNNGEVLGSAIGPGSNSHYFSLSKFNNFQKLSFAFEIIDQDNDFYYEAFSSSQDFRRYWKDLNFHLNFSKKFKRITLSTNLIFGRSLNYQWELTESPEVFYQPGRDVDNFHLNLKLTYFGNW